MNKAAALAKARITGHASTRLVIDQHGVPDDWHDHVNTNWPTFYLTPLTNHFARQPVA